MFTYQKGMFAKSLAGHDKGKLYIIIDLDSKYVYLSNGKDKTVEAPKKKKYKHVQIDCHISDCLSNKTDKEIRNEDIKRAIKLKEAKAGR